ncbi:bifunctional 5,10-methylenetetrahydrofolate dehydrogenase/5,10-methenyltetrahydrofolate cyclohydrolase [bacterium]|nr:bifunctional 5,10-methylenetetrahydrofolate dehydrogenase/5,10-methenyltetrahydrofolate cyclohydrolase [bacterium]
MKIISGKKVSENIFSGLMAKLQKLDESPKLLSIIIGKNPAAISYTKAKDRKASALGAEFKVLALENSLSQKEIEKKIRNYIRKWTPDGIIIERPIPKKIDLNILTNLIPPLSDIDCQRMDSLGMLMSGRAKYIPATAKAVLEILKFYKIAVASKNIVVVGRSLTIGLPLSIILMSKSEYGNATVSVCHSKTDELSRYTKKADIIITAAGKPGLLTADMVTKKSVVIDVGTTYKNGKLLGDVDFSAVAGKVKAITPVPGGVGPVTTACLFQNLVNACIGKRNKKL